MKFSNEVLQWSSSNEVLQWACKWSLQTYCGRQFSEWIELKRAEQSWTELNENGAWKLKNSNGLNELERVDCTRETAEWATDESERIHLTGREKADE